jgi:hypothetical protein
METKVDDENVFIEVNVPKNASMNDSTVLHHFNDIDLHFTSFLRGQSGLQYDATPTQSDPTIVISKQTPFMGTSLDEYTVTSVYIVPTIHASNRIPQASQSDLEIIMEHSTSSSSGTKESKTRLFLCAIVSPDNVPVVEEVVEVDPPLLKKLVGSDPGFVEFVQTIDTSSTTPAQFRINNSRILPVSVSFTFPGITECLEYSDVDSNRVLLLTSPLLLPESMIQALSAQISVNSAPIFGSFDLIPASTSVERMKFLSNRVSTGSSSFGSSIGSSFGNFGGSVNNIKTDLPESEMDSNEVVDGFETRTCPKKTSPSDDAIFALNSMALALVLIPLCVLCWLYYPWLYSKQVVFLNNTYDNKINDGVWRVRYITIGYLIATIIMISVSSSYRNWLSMIIGLCFVVLWITAIVAVQVDVNSNQSIIKSELNNNENIHQVWLRDNYDHRTTTI